MGEKEHERELRGAAVLGAGSWGTALAIHLSRLGVPTRLWGRRAEVMDEMARARENRPYLPGRVFPAPLEPTSDLAAALAGAELVVAAVPSHALGATLGSLPALDPGARVLLACKGVETESLDTMAQVARKARPELGPARLSALGGPSFAAEVADGQPTTVVVGCEDDAAGRALQAALSGANVRAYVTDDLIGVELGGAFKNVIALAAGMCDGAGLGNNARAGLITRGLAEITRLAVALGARQETLAGLSGLGDLVLTCTGGLSRNRRVGVALGRGLTLDQALAEVGQVAEGVKTTRAAHRLAARTGVEMPIASTMHAILYEGLTVPRAVERLMERRLRSERDP